MPLEKLTRLVDDGNEHTVLIPPDFAFGCEELEIERRGSVVVLSPVRSGRDEDAGAR